MVVAPARAKAATMSTRCPAQVKRTAVTSGKGTHAPGHRPAREGQTLAMARAAMPALDAPRVRPGTRPSGRARTGRAQGQTLDAARAAMAPAATAGSDPLTRAEPSDQP